MTPWAHELTQPTTRVGRLCVRGTSLDPLAVQRRAEAALTACRFGEIALPESAILCIRSFRDPLPGTLHLQGQNREANAAWQQAAAAALEGLLRRAPRPALETVPAGADAVLFLSPAEMLVSLARDWCRSETGTRWWWRSLFPGAEGSSGVLRVWRERAEHVPAALHQLAGEAQAAPFLQALGPPAARALWVAVAEKFGLAALLAELEAAPSATPSEEKTAPPGTRSPCPEAAPAPRSPARSAPWRTWVAGHEEAGLTGDSLLLLVTGLLLYRAPVALRAPGFARQARAWMRSTEAALAGPQPPPADDEATQESAEGGSPLALRSKPTPVRPPTDLASSQERSPVPAAQPVAFPDPGLGSHLPKDPPVPLPPSPSEPFRQRPMTSAAVTESPGSVPLKEGEAAVPAIPVAESQPPLAAKPAAETTTDVADALRCQIVETEFGGILYLINLGLFLNLYGDFTSPLKPGIALPIWDFVALVGRHLVGARLREDPVWALLARLSGRNPETEPGEGFLAPEDWPLPEDWADFCTTLPLDTEPYGAAPAGPLIEWLDWLLPYLRWRLDRALGLDFPDQIAGLLCEQPACIRVTDARVEITFSLNRLPVQVRLSGLDRDPGWVPAAGRAIAFRYD
jgi:hypothetical protein